MYTDEGKSTRIPATQNPRAEITCMHRVGRQCTVHTKEIKGTHTVAPQMRINIAHSRAQSLPCAYPTPLRGYHPARSPLLLGLQSNAQAPYPAVSTHLHILLGLQHLVQTLPVFRQLLSCVATNNWHGHHECSAPQLPT